MKFASRKDYNFSGERAKKEGSREFLEKLIDSSHVPILMQIAEEMNLSFLDACKYYFSMFNAIQDLVNMHHNFTLPNVTVATITRTEKGKARRDLVYKARTLLSEPYFKNAATAWEEAKNRQRGFIKLVKPAKSYEKKMIPIQKAKAKISSEKLKKTRKKAHLARKRKIRRKNKRKSVGLF